MKDIWKLHERYMEVTGKIYGNLMKDIWKS
jgi:hypothetical protein